MPSSTVRISGEAKQTLQKLSGQTRKPMQDILDAAVELYRRHLFLAEANAAFARMKEDPEAWAEELEERAAWDNTSTNRPTD